MQPVVHCHIGIRVRCAQDGLVRLTDHRCDLRAIPHHKTELRLLLVSYGHRYQKRALEPRTTTTTVTAMKTDMDAFR